jgi:hypothetical protein
MFPAEIILIYDSEGWCPEHLPLSLRLRSASVCRGWKGEKSCCHGAFKMAEESLSQLPRFADYEPRPARLRILFAFQSRIVLDFQ